jgi:hypothetical protein
MPETLRREGYDVVRASEIGQARADDEQILQEAISEGRTYNLQKCFRASPTIFTPSLF